MMTVVPDPGSAETEMSPPSCCARSRMPRIPSEVGLRRSASDNPIPLSRISSTSVSSFDESFTGDDYCGRGAKVTGGAGAVIGPCGA